MKEKVNFYLLLTVLIDAEKVTPNKMAKNARAGIKIFMMM